MKNVVVTGVGIVSCIGSDTQEVLNSLKKGQSGISKNSTYADMGFRSHVSGAINLNLTEVLHFDANAFQWKLRIQCDIICKAV